MAKRYVAYDKPYIQTDNLDAAFGQLRKTGGQDREVMRVMTDGRVAAPSVNPDTALVHRGLAKRAQTGYVYQSNVHSHSEFLMPQIRNPLLSATNFFLPGNNQEMNLWIRYFDRFHPIVGNALDMHASVPFSRFQLTGINDPYIQQFYEDMSAEIDLFRRILEVSREYELIGECFPFGYWDEEMNAFSDIAILNPDYIEVKGIKMAGKKGLRYELRIDEQLREFILSDDPLDWEILSELDPALIRAAESGLNAPLDPFNLSHLARLASPYDDRGTSIVLGCLKDLMYEERLREAQYTVAGGIVRPREIWKLGIKGEYMPTDSDLVDLRRLLRSSEFDPNFAIISHHGLQVDFVGADRRMLPLDREYAEIEKRILTRLYTSRAMTHGEGPCHLPEVINSQGDTETIEILSQRGFIPWNELLQGEAIAAFNPHTEQIEFHVPVNRIVRDYDGQVVDIGGGGKEAFSTTSFKRSLNLSMTSNHRMWIRKGLREEWEIIPAKNLKENHHLRCDVKPQEGEAPEVVIIDGYRHHRFIDKYRKKKIKIGLDNYLEFVGYYLSEGNIDFEKRYKEPHPSGITITQSLSSKNFEKIKSGLNKLPFNITFDEKSRFRICDRLFAEHVCEEFGQGSANKKIASWIKQLPADKLEILIEAMLDGDGHIYAGGQRCEYYTISEQLSKDFQEMAFRAGYVTYNTYRDRKGNRRRQYRCKISNGAKSYGRHPNLRGLIKKRHYKGKVWCFEVPPHELFVIRSAGKIYITGNTYSNASVAMKILDARYATKRDFIIDWVVSSIFTPVALANEFYKPIKRELAFNYRVSQKERELILPDFKWLSLVNLVDKQQQIQYALQLFQKSTFPLKEICDMLQIDYNNTLTYLRQERGTVADPVWQEVRKQSSLAAARNVGQGDLAGSMKMKEFGGDGEKKPDEEAQEQIAKEVEESAEQDEQEVSEGLRDAAEDAERAHEKTLGPEPKTFGLGKKKEESILAGKEFLGKMPKDISSLLEDFSKTTTED